jgi:hypothetical protein
VDFGGAVAQRLLQHEVGELDDTRVLDLEAGEEPSARARDDLEAAFGVRDLSDQRLQRVPLSAGGGVRPLQRL